MSMYKGWLGRVRLSQLSVAVLMAVSAALALRGADFSATTPNNQFSYLINGVSGNPTITLVRGKTYTFDINTDGDHPFMISTSLGADAPPGVSGANGASTGTITFNVPANAQDCVYFCTFHFFSGNIHMVDPAPPPPPVVSLVGLTLGDTLKLTSVQSTTNGFTFIPEANTDLRTTNWFALTVQSNRFANGTNEIFCGKPPGTNAFFRIRIQ